MSIKYFARSIEEYVTLVMSFFIGFIRFRNKKIDFKDINRIVIIKLDHLGDVILSTPAIANIRENLPNAHIALAVNSSSEQIAKMIPYVDEIIVYNAKFFDRSGKAKAFDILKGIRFAKDMKRKRFDLIVDLRGSFASLLYAVIADSKYRIDRGSCLIKRRFGNKGHSDAMPLQDRKGVYKGDEWSGLHEANVSLNILAEAGFFIDTRETFIDPSIILPMDSSLRWNDTAPNLSFQRRLESREKHKDTLNDAGNSKDNAKTSIVIHAGGPMLLKRWASDRFAELIKRLLQNYSAQIFLIGGKDEYDLAESILDSVSMDSSLRWNDKSINDRVINLSGKMTLAELACLLKKADLFIGNDSGPMHIASACGTKVIGLYGPTNPERFGPYGRNCVALRMEDKCPPCAQDKCKLRDYRCIDRISVDNVINVIKEIL